MRAEISVFFTVIMMLVFALLMGIAESARLQSSRVYLAVASNSAIESLFSQYHKELWDKYRILGLEHYSDSQLADEMSDFIKPYFKAKDLYPMSLEKISIVEKELLTDRNGAVMEKEILDYMKYGIAVNIPQENQLITYREAMTEAVCTEAVYEKYFKRHMKAAMKIEDIVDDIKKCLEAQSAHYALLLRQAESFSLSGVVTETGDIKAELKKLPALITEYSNETLMFYEALLETEAKLELDYKEGSLGKGIYEKLSLELLNYKEYFSEDGKRSKAILGLKDAAKNNIDFLDQLIELAELAEMEVNDFVPQYEGDEPDIALIWQPVIDECRRYSVLELTVLSGVQNKEKRRKLESLLELRKGNLLSMLLPENMEISKAKIDNKHFPSKGRTAGHNSGLNILDRYYISEYMNRFISYYNKPSAKKSASKDMFYGVEYILKGKDSNFDNLAAVVDELVAIRTGLNLIYLYNAPEKQSEAMLLAAEIVGAVGLTPLTGVVKNMIMIGWAFGQGLCDVRDLLHDRKVPFLHSSADFYLDLNGLLDIAVSKKLKEHEGCETGACYIEYLKLMHMLKHSSIYSYRIMDMIQLDLSEAQQDFLVERCANGISTEVKVDAGRVFTSLRLFENVSNRSLKGSYPMTFVTAEAY